MDGFEATAIIREEEKSGAKHIPIVAMTAHAMVGDRERSLVAGVDAYVSKPINAADLFAAIERVMLLPHKPTRRCRNAGVPPAVGGRFAPAQIDAIRRESS